LDVTPFSRLCAAGAADTATAMTTANVILIDMVIPQL
jgi:hypothetical protein